MRRRFMPMTPLTAIAISVLALSLATAAPPLRVTIELNATPLAEALNRLQDASGLRLAFSNDAIAGAEPVALSAKDEPVDDALLKILRPRGLEFIRIDAASGVVIRADTDLAMAKRLGGALRTLASLASKLDAARQEGGGVVVPGWTDADDRGAAGAVVELLAAHDYFRPWRMPGVPQPNAEAVIPSREAILWAARAADADARAGVGAAFGIRSSPRALGSPRLGDASVREAVHTLRNDRDPLVRACWLGCVTSCADLFPDDRGELLASAFAKRIAFMPAAKWESAGANLRPAIIAALGKAADEECRGYAAAVLGDLFAHPDNAAIRADAEMCAAMDAARSAVEQAGTPEQKAAVLRGAVFAAGDAVAGPALAELEKLIIGGALPPAARFDAIEAIGSAIPRCSPGFKQYLLKVIANAEGPSRFRSQIVGKLAGCPELLEPLVDTLVAVTARRGPDSHVIGGFGGALQGGLRKATAEAGQPPPWLLKTAALARSIMNDAKLGEYDRGAGMVLCLQTGMPQTVDDVAALAFDPQLDVRVRMAAVCSLMSMASPMGPPESLATRFNDLPPVLRKEIIQRDNYNARALREALLVRALKDDTMRAFLKGRLGSAQPPFSPEFVAALEARADDPVLKYDVKQLLDKQAKAGQPK